MAAGRAPNPVKARARPGPGGSRLPCPAIGGAAGRRVSTRPGKAGRGRGRPYDDVRPVLRRLRAEGVRAAIVSNTPWGSPGDLWREELARLGLAEEVDLAVFCTDVGWRKPAAAIFEYTLARLDARPADCFFVGDNPRWDVAGPRAVGIEAVLLDRQGTGEDGETIRDLHGLWPRLWPGREGGRNP
ncbi:MAG: HAD family hydrolase [Anaerolineae bacterium]